MNWLPNGDLKQKELKKYPHNNSFGKIRALHVNTTPTCFEGPPGPENTV